MNERQTQRNIQIFHTYDVPAACAIFARVERVNDIWLGIIMILVETKRMYLYEYSSLSPRIDWNARYRSELNCGRWRQWRQQRPTLTTKTVRYYSNTISEHYLHTLRSRYDCFLLTRVCIYAHYYCIKLLVFLLCGLYALIGRARARRTR